MSYHLSFIINIPASPNRLLSVMKLTSTAFNRCKIQNSHVYFPNISRIYQICTTESNIYYSCQQNNMKPSYTTGHRGYIFANNIKISGSINLIISNIEYDLSITKFFRGLKIHHSCFSDSIIRVK